MNLGKINVITPPDKLFNKVPSILLVKPSMELKEHFQKQISKVVFEINVYVFDDVESDIDWMLSVNMLADITVIDIDNCDVITKSFATLLLSDPDCYYTTQDEITPYGLISKNRIYNLENIPFFMEIEEIDEDEDEEEEEEE
jgi:hypothetical protein